MLDTLPVEASGTLVIHESVRFDFGGPAPTSFNKTGHLHGPDGAFEQQLLMAGLGVVEANDELVRVHGCDSEMWDGMGWEER